MILAITLQSVALIERPANLKLIWETDIVSPSQYQVRNIPHTKRRTIIIKLTAIWEFFLTLRTGLNWLESLPESDDGVDDELYYQTRNSVTRKCVILMPTLPIRSELQLSLRPTLCIVAHLSHYFESLFDFHRRGGVVCTKMPINYNKLYRYSW